MGVNQGGANGGAKSQPLWHDKWGGVLRCTGDPHGTIDKTRNTDD